MVQIESTNKFRYFKCDCVGWRCYLPDSKQQQQSLNSLILHCQLERIRSGNQSFRRKNLSFNQYKETSPFILWVEGIVWLKGSVQPLMDRLPKYWWWEKINKMGMWGHIFVFTFTITHRNCLWNPSKIGPCVQFGWKLMDSSNPKPTHTFLTQHCQLPSMKRTKLSTTLKWKKIPEEPELRK